MSAADQLARLRVAVATGRLPADLGRWALERLCELLPDTERIEARNHLLRRAAGLVDGSVRARARALRSEIVSMERRRHIVGEVRELVAAALELDPSCPRSERQLRRIIAWDTEAVSMAHDLRSTR